MKVTRRSAIQGAGAALALSASGSPRGFGLSPRAEGSLINVFSFMSPAEVADVQAFTYGKNVTAALNAAAASLQRLGGGTLLLPRGGYLVGLQVFRGRSLDGTQAIAYGPTEIITVRNCKKPVTVSGYGAVLKAEPGLKYGSFDPTTGSRHDPDSLPFTDALYYAYPYRAMVNLEDNASVVVEGLELDGRNMLLTLGGYWGDSQWQVEGHGIWCHGNSSALLRDCYVHHQPCDGITLKGRTEAAAGRVPITRIHNVRSRYNGRLGISITGGRSIEISKCDFSLTGQALNTVSNEMLRSSPGAGIDIEPEGSIVRDVSVSGTTIMGNWLKGVVGTSGDSRAISFRDCKLENLYLSRPNWTFNDCILIGFANFGLAPTDPYTSTTRTVADAQSFRGCTFTYDPGLTDSRHLINDAQSLMDEAIWSRFVRCRFETGSVNLPSFNLPSLAESSPVFADCGWKSTSSSPVAIHGRFEGYNYIEHGGRTVLDMGTKSRIESGDVFLNGVSQRASAVSASLPVQSTRLGLRSLV